MNRTQRAEIGLRPALSRNETTAGQLARTYVELDSRELSAMRYEMAEPAAAVRIRTEDAAGLAVPSHNIKIAVRYGMAPESTIWYAAYWAAIP